MKSKILIFLFLLIFYNSSLSAFNYATEKGFWPFYFQNSDNSTALFAPFINWNKDKFIFRPLFLKEKNNFYFLYPIVEFSETKDKITKRIFPLFNRTYNKNKIQEEKFTSFLLVFWGRTGNNKTYGGFFPIYGKLIKTFNYDEINFYLWPLYFNKRKQQDIDYNIIWPFFGYSKGDNYKGIRIWPLYGYTEKKDYKTTMFYLWPLFIFRDKKIGPNEWEHQKLFFPFYIHTYSKNYNYNTFLYPFFRYNKRGENYKYYGLPWPFIIYRKFDKKHYSLSFFPLFKRVYKKNLENFSLLWVLYKNEKTFLNKEKEIYERKTSFLLINRFETNYKQHTKYKNIWPFFEYWENNESYIFKAFELFPFKIPVVYELYSAFFNIFTIVKKGNNKKINFLWGLFSYEKNGKEKCFKVFKFLKFYWDDSQVKENGEFAWNLFYNLGT